MNTLIENEFNQEKMEIPKSFWRYYDLYRRKVISLEEYSIKTELSEEAILKYLFYI